MSAHLREELLAQIQSWDVPLETELDADTPLIQSGLFDSMALLNLLQWIEEQIGASIDPSAYDLAAEWDTVDLVVRFVEARRAEAAAG